jgi:peptidoglycan/LPS O-acetylase OafA/YrhL
MFYLFFPLACRGLRRRGLMLGLLAILVVMGPFARSTAFNLNPVWREYSYLGGMDAIALGCLTAWFCARRTISRAGLWMLGGGGTVVLVFILGFSLRVERWGLGKSGLDMTILAVGVCMLLATAAQTQWRAPRVVQPLVRLGRYSYEIYLTHMFVVLALFRVFVAFDRPIWLVPVLFVGVVVVAGLLGAVVSRRYSERLNRWLREIWDDGPKELGSVVETP